MERVGTFPEAFSLNPLFFTNPVPVPRLSGKGACGKGVNFLPARYIT